MKKLLYFLLRPQKWSLHKISLLSTAKTPQKTALKQNVKKKVVHLKYFSCGGYLTAADSLE